MKPVLECTNEMVLGVRMHKAWLLLLNGPMPANPWPDIIQGLVVNCGHLFACQDQRAFILEYITKNVTLAQCVDGHGGIIYNKDELHKRLEPFKVLRKYS